MMNFDILDIQKNIEEKRQIYGKRLEDFLLSKFRNFLKKSDELFTKRIFCFWLVSLFFSLSIFLRSQLDIGYLSAFELVNSRFSLLNSVNLVSLKISQICGFNEMIIADYFINFLAIISLIFSAKILKKSRLSATNQNLIIIAFALGFFLQIGAIEYGEFIVENSLFLILVFPYISYLIKNSHHKSQIFSILIFGIIIFTIFAPYISKTSFSTVDFINFLVSQLFSKIILFAIFLVFLYKKISEEDKVLLISALAGLFILCLGFFTNRNYESCFFALITPAIVKIFYDFVKFDKIDFTNKLLFAFLPLVALLDEGLNFVRSLIFFWIIIIPIAVFSLREKFTKDHKLKLLNISPFFILLAIVAIVLSFRNHNLFVFLSVLIFFLFLFYYEKFYQKSHQAFSSLFAFVQFVVIFSLLSFYVFAISKSLQGNSVYKSPNYLSDNIIKYSNAYLHDKNDKIIILSDALPNQFPTLNFLHQKNNNKDLKNFISDEKIRIIFIDNKSSAIKENQCFIGYLENNFLDLEFRKSFLENYQYLGKIFLSKDLEKKPQLEFFAKEKDEFDNVDLSRQKVIYDFEIYIRRND
ncbi:MAG: hypothetical protein KGQ36_04695 [Rickettsiales bacterium]|nr:hypothetical protein [Rickettsiales bacterium]